MNISAKTEYACIAILELAKRQDIAEPIRIKEIAEPHKIPSRFLVQILLQLKSAGLVSSTRGASGGYRLEKKPEEISLLDVMNVIEGSTTIKSNLKEDTPGSRVLQEVWQTILERSNSELAKIDFQELVKRTNTQSENMYYI